MNKYFGKAPDKWGEFLGIVFSRKIRLAALLFMLIAAFVITLPSLVQLVEVRIPPPANIVEQSPNQLTKATYFEKGLRYEVPIYKFYNLDSLNRTQISEFREKVLRSIPNLLSQPYTLSTLILPLFAHQAPWLSVRDFYYHGKKRWSAYEDVLNESASSIAALNPLLLAKPEFWSYSIWHPDGIKWKHNRVKRKDLESTKFPFAPQPSEVFFYPHEKKIEVTYNLTEYYNSIQPYLAKPLKQLPIDFGLLFINARDLGFLYVQLNPLQSENIIAQKTPKEAVPILDRFEVLPVSWLKGSRRTHDNGLMPSYDFMQVTNLPAKISLNFWKAENKNQRTPDMNFIIMLK